MRLSRHVTIKFIEIPVWAFASNAVHRMRSASVGLSNFTQLFLFLNFEPLGGESGNDGPVG
jgi:hypothetical protein